jgi:molybdopterin molybdotransferase
MQHLITVNEAAEIIHSNLPPSTRTESVPLSEAYGRYLRELILADRPLPPFDRVMMDGIAIRHSVWTLGKKAFPVAATQAAGAPPIDHSDVNTCIEVMTGGVLPNGCDCVIPVEEIDIHDQTAHIRDGYIPQSSQHIHRAGSDAPPGEILLPAGQCLGAPELAIAASCGAISLLVAALPQITLISTGDELVAPEQTPLTHQIRRSHATALHASITARKLGNINECHVPDDPTLLKEALQKALVESDIIVLTGGVSRGKYDYVAPVLKELLGEPQFHGIAQRPGKPLAFWANKNHSPVFALPGNPVSVMACAARYLFPAISQMLKGCPTMPDTLPAHGSFNCPPHFTGLTPCRMENGTLHLLPPTNSGNFLSLAGTHGIAELPGKLTRTELTDSPAKFYPW